MDNVQITALQAVDYAFGNVLSACFNALDKTAGPKALQRFLAKPDKERLFIVKNDDVQRALRKVTARANEPGKGGPDLPVVLYYREQGLTADMNQHIQVAEVTRFTNETTINGPDKALQVTTIPLTLTYSILFLAWDRATIEHMALAWWAHIAPLGRKNSRFTVPYSMHGETFEVGATVNSPREILTSFEQLDEENSVHLWGSRTMAEINTQAVYGANVTYPDMLRIIGHFEFLPQ